MMLLYSTSIFVLICQLSNTGIGFVKAVSVEIEASFVPPTNRQHKAIKDNDACKCEEPDKHENFDDTTCKPISGGFPAHVAECKCRACKLNITLHCTCDERNNAMLWKAEKDICKVDDSSTLKTPLCYDSPPTNAVMDFDRCRRGYNGETAQARCQFSCRPVQVICKSNGNWEYSNVSEKCLGTEGNPIYSGANPDGLSFTINTNGDIFDFLCPAYHLIKHGDKNPANCKNGVITGNFPTCKPILTQTPEPTETPKTTEPSTHEIGTQTDPSPLLEDKVNNTETTGKNLNPIASLGWIEYLLIFVIVLFLVILTGLWSWYAKDKMRVARLKRAAVDNRNGHPCIL